MISRHAVRMTFIVISTADQISLFMDTLVFAAFCSSHWHICTVTGYIGVRYHTIVPYAYMHTI